MLKLLLKQPEIESNENIEQLDSLEQLNIKKRLTFALSLGTVGAAAGTVVPLVGTGLGALLGFTVSLFARPIAKLAVTTYCAIESGVC